MAVYRYLPIPSDRMGFLWAVTNIKGVAVLEFGPMGTTNFATRHMGEAPIYSTHINDSVLTFGDSQPLRQAVLELEKRTHPILIYVMQSASTAIIGFDMEAFCEELQPEVQAKLIPITLSGLSADYTVGMAKGLLSLAEQFLEPAAEKTSVFHILGAAVDDTRIFPDVEEITRLMQGAFGLEPGLILPCSATAAKLRAAGKGCISLVLRREALPAAEYLQSRADIPYLEGIPLGVQGTLNWLEQVGNLLGRRPSSEFVSRELASLESLEYPKLQSVCILSGSSMAEAFARLFLQEWQVPKVGAFAFEKHPQSGEGTAVQSYTETALDDWIQQNRPELLLGNSVVTERDFGYPAKRLGIRKPHGIPNQDPPETAGFLGWRGIRNLVNALQPTRNVADKAQSV